MTKRSTQIETKTNIISVGNIYLHLLKRILDFNVIILLLSVQDKVGKTNCYICFHKFFFNSESFSNFVQMAVLSSNTTETKLCKRVKKKESPYQIKSFICFGHLVFSVSFQLVQLPNSFLLLSLPLSCFQFQILDRVTLNLLQGGWPPIRHVIEINIFYNSNPLKINHNWLNSKSEKCLEILALNRVKWMIGHWSTFVY